MKTQTKRRRLVVHVSRLESGGWEGLAPRGVRVTGRSLARVRELVRDAAERTPDDEIELRFAPELAARVDATRARKDAAEREAREAQHAVRELALSLEAEGWTRRDVAEALGYSFQWIQRLVGG